MNEKFTATKRHTAITLGYLGLLPPFISLSASLANYISVQESFDFCLLYANMILSFLGGTHWYAGIFSEIGKPKRKILSGIFASLLGVISLLIGSVFGAILTIAGLLILGGIEKYAPLSSEGDLQWYLSLRVNLTTGLVSLLIVNLWFSS